MNTLIKQIISITFLFLASCSSLKPHEKNVEALKKIKKVAIIGFTVVEPVASSLDPLKPSTNNILVGTAKHADQMWAQLFEVISNKTNWQVVSSDVMKKNPAYQVAYKSTMEGWQNKMPPGEHVRLLGIQSVMDYESLRILKPEEKKKLMKELRVDALLVAKVNVGLIGTTVMGIGDRYPQVSVNVQAFSLDSDNDIWRESFTGEKSEKSVGKTNFFDEEILVKASLEGSKSALNKIQL
ncbi:MAG TPA: hypothetical protein PLJ21_07865 [Pseudobdellovibrionaceae bacterium]|nr:hypothetical protein [Pseudobdellovibrionaceae bacterium]